MGEIKKYSSLFVVGRVLLLSCLLIIITVGCASNGNIARNQFSNNDCYYNRPASPRLVFDMPLYRGRTVLPPVDSERIGRYDWPAYPEATGFVTIGEISRYRERYYDDQYINTDNRPRQNFHRQITVYRDGLKVR